MKSLVLTGHWQVATAFHHTMLHEHNVFFLDTSRPNVLAVKSGLPASMGNEGGVRALDHAVGRDVGVYVGVRLSDYQMTATLYVTYQSPRSGSALFERSRTPSQGHRRRGLQQ